MVQVKRSNKYPYWKRISKTVFILRRHGCTHRKSAGIHKKTTEIYTVTEYKAHIQKSRVFLFSFFSSVTEFLQNFEYTWATAKTTSVYHAGCHYSLRVIALMHVPPPSSRTWALIHPAGGSLSLSLSLSYLFIHLFTFLVGLSTLSQFPFGTSFGWRSLSCPSSGPFLETTRPREWVDLQA